MTDFPPYPSGLRLVGRRVVVVGGGHVAQRRIPPLIGAGADVVVVAPEVTPAIEGLASEVTLTLREFTEADLDEAWYVIAATDVANTATAANSPTVKKIFVRIPQLANQAPNPARLFDGLFVIPAAPWAVPDPR
ncbi:MAG: hypothetical protein L0H93_14440 [Nocardioides sp.]|nr:hypothetical protein [Nocardioides sp.]